MRIEQKDPPTPWLTEAEVAQRIGVHVQTLRTWRREGSGPKFSRLPGGPKLPGDLRYRATTVDAWLESRGVSA